MTVIVQCEGSERKPLVFTEMTQADVNTYITHISNRRDRDVRVMITVTD